MDKVKPATSICPRCLGRSYVIEPRGDFAAARVCECSRPCRFCSGAGYTLSTQVGTFSERMGPRTYEVLAPCSCRLLDTRIACFNEAGIPSVLAHAGFDNYKPCTPSQSEALEAARQFAMEYRRGKPGRGFVLSGPVGAGKTHLMLAALSHLLLELGVRAMYVEISLLFATIRNGFREGKSGGEIIKPLAEVEVLAIDELGKGRGSQFEMETLDELIARRYNASRTTLFATNYSLEYDKKRAQEYYSSDDLKAAGRESPFLQMRVGDRIYSRLCEMCQFVEMPGAPDHRYTEHEKQRPARPPPGRRHR